MPTQQMDTARDLKDEVVMEYQIREPASPNQLTEAIMCVCAAIDLVKRNMERFVARAGEVLR